jgi:hypothetical protein
MPTEYVLQTPPAPQPEERVITPLKKPFAIPALIGGGLLVIVIAVVLGFVLGKSSGDPKTVAITPSPTPSPVVTQSVINPTLTPGSETPAITMLPDKQYFEDSYIVIQKATPHAGLVLSVSRIEQKQNFTQYTRINYFDGKNWDRKSILGTNQTVAISTNPLLRSWNDPAVVERTPEKELASISLPTQTLSFSSTALQNEISLQSLPGSTKFMYQGTGTMVLDGQREPAYVFYSRTYSFNASDLAYLLKPSLLTSSWMVFWDTDGTFYHLDSHTPKNPTSSAQILKIGVRVDPTGVIRKSLDVHSTIESTDTASFYKETFGDSINEEVLLSRANTFDKSDKKAYAWYLSIGEGSSVRREGRTVRGIGLIEQIAGLAMR